MPETTHSYPHPHITSCPHTEDEHLDNGVAISPSLTHRGSQHLLHLQPWFCHLLFSGVLLCSLWGDRPGLCQDLHGAETEETETDPHSTEQSVHQHQARIPAAGKRLAGTSGQHTSPQLPVTCPSVQVGPGSTHRRQIHITFYSAGIVCAWWVGEPILRVYRVFLDLPYLVSWWHTF